MHTGKNLNENQLEENYNQFIYFIESTFEGERKEKLLKLYSEESLGLRAVLAPASGKEHFHLAYPGGYIIHIMNICKCVIGVKKLYTTMGGYIDFTDDEMMFSALNHDLGKLGDEYGEYYLPEQSEWHRKNQGSIFKTNGAIQFMDVTDRALYILQNNDIKVTWKEYLGIKLSDGIYNESNKKYLMAYSPESALKTNLPNIIHMADFISCRVENDSWRYSEELKK